MKKTILFVSCFALLAIQALAQNVFIAGEALDARRDAFGRLRVSNPVSGTPVVTADINIVEEY